MHMLPAFKMLPSIWREKRKTEGRASTISQDKGQINSTDSRSSEGCSSRRRKRPASLSRRAFKDEMGLHRQL